MGEDTKMMGEEAEKTGDDEKEKVSDDEKEKVSDKKGFPSNMLSCFHRCSTKISEGLEQLFYK